MFGREEEVIDKPLPPRHIKEILYSKCLHYDVTQAVLQQELILNIGKFLTTAPHLFDGVLKIRIGLVQQRALLNGLTPLINCQPAYIL